MNRDCQRVSVTCDSAFRPAVKRLVSEANDFGCALWANIQASTYRNDSLQPIALRLVSWSVEIKGE
jgi:hypothetical protein